MPRRDVVVTFFSCPSRVPDERLRCASIVKEIWVGREGEAPVILDAPVGMDAAGYVKKNLGIVAVDGKPYQSFLRPFIASMAPKLEGNEPGRIAVIGFSQGCNGVKEVLSLPFDAAQIDFVYACDGAAAATSANFSSGNLQAEASAIIPESVAPWVNFAVAAAKSASGPGSAPLRSMVITYSKASGRKGSASTAATALRIRQDVTAAVGSAEAPPCIVPLGLIGSDSAQVPEGPWKSSWNNCGPDPNRGGAPTPGHPCSSGAFCPCPANVQPPWPVDWYSIAGNLVIVGFNAVTDNEASCGASCSEPAHVFQSHWVHYQVWKEVLGPRWQVVCTHEKTGEGKQAEIIKPGGSSTAGFGQASQKPYSPIVKRGKLTRIVRVARSGLGQDALYETCGIDGVLSSMFSAGEMARIAAMRNAYALAAGVVGLAAAAALVLWRRGR